MNTPLIPIGLALIMMTVGLSVRLQDFRALGNQLRAVSAGIVAQILFLPAIAFFVALITKLDTVYAIGLIILASAPGGISSNLLTVLARGKTALSISLTIVTNLVAFVTIPTALSVAFMVFQGVGDGPSSSELYSLPFGETAMKVLAISALPLAIGMAIGHFFPKLSQRASNPAKFVASAIFAAIVINSFYSEWSNITAHWSSVGPAVILLNVMAIGSALLFSRLFRLSSQQALTIAIECGLQNVALALVIAQFMGDGRFMIPSSIYALIMNVSVLILIAVGNRLPREDEELVTKR
ncbi:bile acid:Na+ symporter, BASS family [Cohaesibacter sp. ES.047]|uniref:bile acid:sodium symporter family protein n=1 Tax=Cohaesibacter sp. ES.047 TaxID=1798205 RepID=UPI000BC00011|nr:bile acid:sodium symporter family protein [Cohaesibacter sp. ES.047]SNY92846.1 bile acid:Na+ symporter, BASS family [Cohaesibacter sp. ES.047]